MKQTASKKRNFVRVTQIAIASAAFALLAACGVNYPDSLIIEDRYQFKPTRPFAPWKTWNRLTCGVVPRSRGFGPSRGIPQSAVCGCVAALVDCHLQRLTH